MHPTMLSWTLLGGQTAHQRQTAGQRALQCNIIDLPGQSLGGAIRLPKVCW